MVALLAASSFLCDTCRYRLINNLISVYITTHQHPTTALAYDRSDNGEPSIWGSRKLEGTLLTDATPRLP